MYITTGLVLLACVEKLFEITQNERRLKSYIITIFLIIRSGIIDYCRVV